MSLALRSAYFASCALFVVALAACGDDDAVSDGDDEGTLADSGDGDEGPDAGGGVKVDAGPGPLPDAAEEIDGGPIDGGPIDGGPIDGGPIDGGPIDAGPIDAGEPDGAPVDELDGEFLLALVPSRLPSAPIRFIMTVDFTPGEGGGGTADFTFQPINAAACVPGQGGLPVDVAPLAANGIAISPEGAFSINITGATLPGAANPIPIPGFQCTDRTADISVTGTVVNPDLSCGTGVAVLPGTFGAIRIEPGTVGDGNLPPAVTACPSTVVGQD